MQSQDLQTKKPTADSDSPSSCHSEGVSQKNLKRQHFKPSGIEWLGEIPEHWEIKRLKFLAEKIISGGTPNTSIETYWTDESKGSYLWVAIEDITESEFIQDTKKYITKEGLQSSTAKLIPPYSILYSIYASLGKVAYSDKILTTNQAILAIQAKDSLFYKFLFYFLNAYTRYVTILASMTTQNNISLFIVQNIQIPLPPLEEQKAIADYLDKKCDKISQFIESKQKLITLLQEKKQALINAVVCRGLNKNAELKESGVKYLGTIPKHWEIRRLKHIGEIVTGKTPEEKNPDAWGDIMPFVTPEDCNDEKYVLNTQRKISKIGILKFAPIILPKDSIVAVCIGASIGKVAINRESAITNQQINSVIPNKKYVSSSFIYYQISLIMPQAKECFCGFSTLPIINKTAFADLKIPLPPLQEQKAIASYLDTQITKIDLAIEKTKQQITYIKEYKTSLINQAICGRIALKD